VHFSVAAVPLVGTPRGTPGRADDNSRSQLRQGSPSGRWWPQVTADKKQPAAVWPGVAEVRGPDPGLQAFVAVRCRPRRGEPWPTVGRL
jgi:hypothetical protein